MRTVQGTVCNFPSPRASHQDRLCLTYKVLLTTLSFFPRDTMAFCFVDAALVPDAGLRQELTTDAPADPSASAAPTAPARAGPRPRRRRHTLGVARVCPPPQTRPAKFCSSLFRISYLLLVNCQFLCWISKQKNFLFTCCVNAVGQNGVG